MMERRSDDNYLDICRHEENTTNIIDLPGIKNKAAKFYPPTVEEKFCKNEGKKPVRFDLKLHDRRNILCKTFKSNRYVVQYESLNDKIVTKQQVEIKIGCFAVVPKDIK